MDEPASAPYGAAFLSRSTRPRFAKKAKRNFCAASYAPALAALRREKRVPITRRCFLRPGVLWRKDVARNLHPRTGVAGGPYSSLFLRRDYMTSFQDCWASRPNPSAVAGPGRVRTRRPPRGEHSSSRRSPDRSEPPSLPTGDWSVQLSALSLLITVPAASEEADR